MEDILSELTRRIRYDAWANGRIVEALQDLSRPDSGVDAAPLEEALRLLSHLVRARVVWLGRVQGTADARLPFWETDPLPDCRARLDAGTAGWLAYLEAANADALRQEVAYHNSKGHPYRNTPRDILTHLVNHGTHHRGQIALLIRKAGGNPPLTDYIYYLRR